MALELTNSVHEFNKVMTSFVKSEKIEKNQVGVVDALLALVEDYKSDFVNLSRDKPIEIINIFSGLNLLKNFFICSRRHLLEGIAKNENPKSAKDILVFQEDIIQLANLIDEFKLNKHKNIPLQINQISIELREWLREEKLFPSIEELTNYKKPESKYVEKIFSKALDQ